MLYTSWSELDQRTVVNEAERFHHIVPSPGPCESVLYIKVDDDYPGPITVDTDVGTRLF
jgi:hypothetical protein